MKAIDREYNDQYRINPGLMVKSLDRVGEKTTTNIKCAQYKFTFNLKFESPFYSGRLVGCVIITSCVCSRRPYR